MKNNRVREFFELVYVLNKKNISSGDDNFDLVKYLLINGTKPIVELSNEELLGENDVYCCNCGDEIDHDDLLKLSKEIICPHCNDLISFDLFEEVFWEENFEW
jgi:hypothetical protein